jgi:hypothetical protein
LEISSCQPPHMQSNTTSRPSFSNRLNCICQHFRATLGTLYSCYTEKKNSVALVRKRTTPTERPPVVGEVSANFCR